MEVTNVLKGTIKEFTYYGHREFLRKGTLHYFPGESIYLNNNDTKNRYIVQSEKRINVIGNHRSGVNRHGKIKLSSIENFEIEELKNPTDKTIKFLDHVGIKRFQLNTPDHEMVKRIINTYESVKSDKIYNFEIADKMYNEAKILIQEIQFILSSSKIEQIGTYLASNIGLRPSRHSVTSEDLLLNVDEYLNSGVRNSILNCDLDLIHPTKVRMIVGQVLFSRRRMEEEFKLSEIQYNEKIKKHKI